MSIPLLLSALFASKYLPSVPSTLVGSVAWYNIALLFAICLVVLYVGSLILRRPVKGMLPSFVVVFALSLLAQMVAKIPQVSYFGFESVFFSVIFGLLIRNLWHVPEWMKPAIQGEFYIKIGVVCLGATILFSDVMKSGIFGLLQACVVVAVVWFCAFWLARTVLPMMFTDPQVVQEVAGAWIGGTIDTTSGVAASSTIVGSVANQHAVIIKAAQNVLIGVVAFFIALFLSARSGSGNRPSLGIVWEKFPKFIIGFVAASLVFSLCQSNGMFTVSDKGKLVEPGVAKMFSTLFFSLAFVCIGLDTRLKDIVSRENRNALWAFLGAQTFNIVVTLIFACLFFGLLKPMWA